MKAQEELNTPKMEYETVTNKLQELTEDKLKMVTGGSANGVNTYYFGDVYKSSACVLYVVTDAINTSGEVHCDYYSYVENDANGLGTYIGKSCVSRLFFKNYTFLFHIDNYEER